MSKEDLNNFVQKGGKDAVKAARLAEKARAAAIATAAAATLTAEAATARELPVQDAQPDKTEHVVATDNNTRAPAMQEGDISYADYAGAEKGKTIADKLGVEIEVDEDGKAYMFSRKEENGGYHEVETKRPGQIKREYNKEQKEGFKYEDAGAIIYETADVSDTMQDGMVQMGAYDYNAKYTTLNQFDKESALGHLISNSVIDGQFEVHEKQHETSDRLNAYAPGISPEQRAVVNMNDEMAAKTAELWLYINKYKEAIKSGASQEEALKIFDKDPSFNFYREALANGLNPDSKEGKKLLVQGTCDMWMEKYSSSYAPQLANLATLNIEKDVPGMVVGNQQETEKRIKSIFDKVCDNDYCKQHGIDSPGNLSQYLEMDKVSRLPDNIKDGVEKGINDTVRNETGLSKQEREAAADSLNGKTDKAKQREIVKGLRHGLSAAEQQAAKEAKANQKETKQTEGQSQDMAMAAALHANDGR